MRKAMLLFWKQGYHHTSVQDLVNELGISRGSLYDTFGGKKQLFDRALDLYRQSNRDGLRGFLKTQDRVRPALRAVFQKIVEDDCADPDCKGCFIANTTTELLPDDAELLKKLALHKKNTEQDFYELLQRGVDSGEIPPGKDLRAIAGLLYMLMQGLRVVGKTKPAQKKTMTALEQILSILD